MSADPQKKLDLEPSAQERLTRKIVQHVAKTEGVRGCTVSGVGIALIKYDGVFFKVEVTEVTPP